MVYSEPEFAGFYSISFKQDWLKNTNPRSKQRAPGSHMLYPRGGPMKTFQIELLCIMKKHKHITQPLKTSQPPFIWSKFVMGRKVMFKFC